MKNKKVLKIINFAQILFSGFILYSLYNSKLIPDGYKLFGLIGLSILTLVWIFLLHKAIIKYKPVVPIVLLAITYLVCAAGLYGVFAILKVEGAISSITGKNTMEVSSVFITMDDSITSIDDFKGKKIGLLSNESDYEGHILPLEELDKQKVDYDITYVTSSLDLMGGLVEGTYDIIALPEDYQDRFEVNEDFAKNYDDFHVILNVKKTVAKPDNSSEEGIKEGEPFTIVLLGTDSDIETHHHNYDVIILVTFNPTTRDMVITSVYRATGMYSSCIGGMDLVNHNGWKGWGPECLMTTVEDFFEIDIDNYILVDFAGFIELVDSIGGITVDIPQDFCEQDSERRHGKYTICLDAGEQTLNGEQALAFARNRHGLSGTHTGEDGGVMRSHNHVTVIKAIAEKIVGSDLLFRFNDILGILEDNMETGMTEDELYSLYNNMLNVVKDTGYDMDKINIYSRTINAYGAMLYSPAMNTSVGMGLIYADTYWPAYNTLQTVLYGKTVDPTYYSFELSEDPEYVSDEYLDQATKDKLKLNPYDPRIMPNLVGKPESAARAYVNKYLYFKVYVTYKYSSTVANGLIIDQSIPAGQSVNHRFKLYVTVSKGLDPSSSSIPSDETDGPSTTPQ